MVFSAASAPDPASTELRELRLSLNTPVLAIDDLPVGLARALIAVVEGPAGGPRLEVAIHSLRSDQVLFYACDGAGAAGPDFDAALSFAGVMGFLFDEDEMAGSDEARRQAALQLWTDWVGKAVPQGGEAAAQRAAGERSRNDEPRSDLPASEARIEPILLSKFRWDTPLTELGDGQGPRPGGV
jgi:hypothetical protein